MPDLGKGLAPRQSGLFQAAWVGLSVPQPTPHPFPGAPETAGTVCAAGAGHWVFPPPDSPNDLHVTLEELQRNREAGHRQLGEVAARCPSARQGGVPMCSLRTARWGPGLPHHLRGAGRLPWGVALWAPGKGPLQPISMGHSRVGPRQTAPQAGRCPP